MTLHSRFTIVVALLTMFLGDVIQANAAPPENEKPASLQKSTHIYKTVGDVQIAADAYRPEGVEPRPVVVWIHGGGMIAGSRTQVPLNLLDYCTRERLVLVSLDYRLAPEAKMPQIAEDIKDAFAWLHSEGPKKLHADTSGVVVVGGSAGGCLTMLAGATVRPRPTALVSYWGYGDIDSLWASSPSTHHGAPLRREDVLPAIGKRVITNTDDPADRTAHGNFYRYVRQTGQWAREVTGFDPAGEKSKLAPLCALRQITSDYPPILMIHGTADTDVPYSCSADMAKELSRHGVKHELISIPDAEHGLRDGDPQLVAKAHARALEFIGESLVASTAAAGRYFEVSYPPSTAPGELQFGVTYTVWIPEGTAKLRGIIVHQHGCGVGACKGGETAAHDLHWQTLAKKWDCALLGPSYHQPDKENCRLWCDPRNGSEKTFLRALDDLAEKSQHAELKTVPWCLWGHSGGGFWSSLMQTLHPERIVAIWFRSGTAFAVWEKGEIPKPEIPAAAYQIPMMCNPGAKENSDKRFSGAWTGAMAMFTAYRAKGAPIGFAPDPRTGHECGDARYLAIPFFDSCLAMRLPDEGSADQKLKPVTMSQGWLAALAADLAEPAGAFQGRAVEALWLPNERVAKAWEEYVKTGAVGDTTPPPAPTNAKVSRKSDGAIEITWDAEADFESGLSAFIIQRDGKDIGQLPERPVGKFGRPLFQAMSYHDTPEQPLPAMRFIDEQPPEANHEYTIIAVNSVGLKSAPAKVAGTRHVP